MLKQIATQIPQIARLVKSRDDLAQALHVCVREAASLRDDNHNLHALTTVLAGDNHKLQSNNDLLKSEVRCLRDRVERLQAEIAILRHHQPDTARINPAFPPGHFYSPVVDPDELQYRRSTLFDRHDLPDGIDMRADAQLALLHKLARHADKLAFPADKSPEFRYHVRNPHFGRADSIVLACMMMELRPRRIVEIGSGYSSCVMMDVNERYLDDTTDITFIEPNPGLLHSLMEPGDEKRHRIIASQIQNVALTAIDALQPGDMLFIDSTHVSKCGSDVNFEFFTLLPQLAAGVIVHFHDMFFPFEYPEAWIFDERRSWNELYLMHAFLCGNTNYEILCFNDFLAKQHPGALGRLVPSLPANCAGSLWLLKIS